MPKKSANESMFHKAHRFHIPSHPTEFTAVPWYRLIVRINNPTASVVYSQIYTSLISQLGISNTTGAFLMRLRAIKVWGPIPATNTRLTVVFFDVFDNVSGSSIIGNLPLQELSNYADQVNRARVAYMYSSSQQQKSLIISATSVDTLIEVAGAGAGSVMYVDLWWRPLRSGNPPALDDDIVRMAERLSINSDFVCEDGFFHTGVPPCSHQNDKFPTSSITSA
jgi:hypothetical protein